MTKEIRRLPGPKQIIKRADKTAKPARQLGQKTVGKAPTDSDARYNRIAALIARVRLEQANIATPDEQRRAWVEPIKRYASRQLKGRGGGDRAYQVAVWYAEHWQDSPYVPVAHSGPTFCKKFERLEAAMQRLAPVNGHDLSAAMQQSGIEADLLEVGKGLGLTDIDSDAKLVDCLGQLYGAVKQARQQADLSTDMKLRLGTPYEIVSRYLDWLEDQSSWMRSPTSRVLQFDGQMFKRFRREVEDNEGLDPVDGGQV